MKKFKKLLAVALAAASLCTMLAGCGGSSTSSTTSSTPKESSSTPESTPVSSEADEPQEVENIVWFVRNGNTITDKQAVQDAINEYIEPKIGVNVSIITSAEEPELSLALAAGEDIDIFWTASWSNGYNYIADNSALDLTDLLPNYPDLYNSIPENVWSAAQKDGHNWFVPVYKESAEGATLMYSVPAAEKYGWDMSTVKSYEDLTPMLEQMKQDGATCAFLPKVDQFWVGARDVFSTVSGTSSTVGIRREDGKAVSVVDSEEYKNFVKLMYSWNQAGYISQECVDSTYADNNDNVNDLLSSGNAGFLFWSSTPDADANATLRYGTELKTLLASKNYLSLDGTFGSAYMINNRTEKADACLKFLGLLYTDQTVADLICYGIEGTHYTRDADGYVSVIADSGYTSDGLWSTCSVMSPSIQVGESADKKEQYASFNENALVTPENTFVFDNSNVSAECSAIAAVFGEYGNLMVSGFYDPDEYLEQYSAALKEAGIDTVIAEVQSQYDAFLAK